MTASRRVIRIGFAPGWFCWAGVEDRRNVGAMDDIELRFSIEVLAGGSDGDEIPLAPVAGGFDDVTVGVTVRLENSPALQALIASG